MLYYYVYRLSLRTVYLLMLCGVMLWAAASAIAGERLRKYWRICCAVLLLAAMALMLYYTVLHREPRLSSVIVLQPFASLEAAKKMHEIYRALTMNILLFFPFGLLLPQLLPSGWKIWQKLLVTILAGLMFSVTIEAMQYFLVRGDAETDDVITNILGTFIGTLHLPLASAVKRLIEKGKRSHE